MGNKRRAGLVLLLLSSASLALGLGSRESKPPEARENPGPSAEDRGEGRVRVSGRVRLVGSGPFPQLVISGQDREWYIDREEESKLLDFQQRFVTVEGRESYIDLSFANGSPAGRRYTLRDIRLTGKD